jgi:hypothetical protein
MDRPRVERSGKLKVVGAVPAIERWSVMRLRTIPNSYRKRTRAGLTVLDMIVVCSGALPALWLGSYFHGGWRTAVQYGGAFVFGIAFWCILFLWLLPLLERRGIIKPPSDGANPPAA